MRTARLPSYSDRRHQKRHRGFPASRLRLHVCLENVGNEYKHSLVEQQVDIPTNFSLFSQDRGGVVSQVLRPNKIR
jgi:hypothetical protein